MIRLAGEIFKGYNQPRRDSDGGKKFAVAAKEGNQVRLVRFGDPNMEIKRDDPKRRKSFRARHGCGTPRASDRTKAAYWSCRQWRAGAKVES